MTIPDNPASGGSGAAPRDLGNLVIDAPANQPIDLTAPGAAPAAAPAEKGQPRANTQVVSTGDPQSDYDRAYSSILSGDYELAEAAFRNFLTTYPGDDRAPDAQYWVGESLFARGKYNEAADAFLSGYKAYPKSGKAADTLLKLGLSLAGLGEREAACQTYAEVLKNTPTPRTRSTRGLPPNKPLRTVEATKPLTDGEIAALFAPVADSRTIALAVSGGPDSLALLDSIDRWRKHPGRPAAIVLTVDHRLRPDSGDEAAMVVAIAKQRGMPARLLTATGPAPQSDIEAEARQVRYRLLLGAAPRRTPRICFSPIIATIRPRPSSSASSAGPASSGSPPCGR